MPQNCVIALLRQISGSLPGDSPKLPNQISELSFAQVYLLAKLFELSKARNGPLSLSALAQATGFSKASVCTALKKLRRAGFR